jgi:SAM-dependent methyltransferase
MKTDILKEQKLFDEEIKEWEETINTPRYKYLKYYVIEILKKINLEGKSVLEIGCGISPYLKEIKAKKKFGLDISEELLKRNNQKEAKFIKGNILNCSEIFKEKFDFIFMVGVLHHINKEEHRLAILEVKKLLKDGGLLLIVEPNMVSLTAIYYIIRKIIQKLNNNLVGKIIGFSSNEERYIFPGKLKRILLEENFLIEYAQTIQVLRLPPIRFVKNIDVEKINKDIDNRRKISSYKSGGTVIIFMARK